MLDAGVPFHRPFGNRQVDGSGSNRENISSTPLHISGVRPVFDASGAILTRLFWRFRAGFPALHQWKGIKKIKTFIVYDLDSQMPVAVGEQVSAETARYCASVATGIFQTNLLAEEIDLEKQITY